MFRFLALAWRPDAPPPALPTLRAGWEWHHHGHPPALDRPGIAVWALGTEAGINEAYPLPQAQGVVLGKLFRHDGSAVPRLAFADDPAQTQGLLGSGGRSLVEQRWGRYVAFLVQPDRITVIRDPSGALPCYQLRHEGVDLVFSWLEDALAVLPAEAHPTVNRDGLAAALAFGELTGRRTALDGVCQVLPGESVQLAHDAPARTFLWSATRVAQVPSEPGIAAAAEALRQTVRDCTRAWASCHDTVLLRLSGGVDSSIVLSCLDAPQTATRVVCVNYHSPGVDGDERPLARLAARRAGRDLREIERDTDFRLERLLDVARLPAPAPYAGRLSSASDAALAASIGARAMFTGGGGDQLFFEFAQWWPAADRLRLRGPGPGFLSAALDAARLARLSLWRTLQLALQDRLRRDPPPLIASPDRLLIGDEVRERAAHPDEFMHPALQTRCALPIGKLTQVQQLTYPGGYYDPYAREAAPELVNPLLSQPLIERCLALPTYLLAVGGRGRGLARRAFAADLPPEITSRRSKGGMDEHLEAVLSRNIGFARELLLDGELARLGLLDRRATEALLTGAAGDRFAHAGEVHLALAVEAWWQRCARRRAPRPS